MVNERFSAHLVVEVDNGQHGMPDGQRSGRRRDAHLLNPDFGILRFWNNDVLSSIGGVMDAVVQASHGNTPNPSPQGGGARTVGRRTP